MEIVNIMGVHQFFEEGITKNNIYEKLPKMGRLAKNREGVFEGGFDAWMHTMT